MPSPYTYVVMMMIYQKREKVYTKCLSMVDLWRWIMWKRMNALKLRSCFNNVPEHEELSRLNCKKPSIIFARCEGSYNNRVSSFPNLRCFFFVHTSIALRRGKKHILRVRSTPVRTMCSVLCLHFIHSLLILKVLGTLSAMGWVPFKWISYHFYFVFRLFKRYWRK